MSTAEETTTVLGSLALHGISDQQYRGIVAALGGPRFRHAYDGWTLEVIGETRAGNPATLPLSARQDGRVVTLHDIAPKQYREMLSALGDHRMRHTYYDRTLDIMSPSRKHEWENRFLDKLLTVATYDLDINIISLGSWTLRQDPDDIGIEPDSCYYIANEPVVRLNKEIDLSTDPPPDLAIEVDVSYSTEPRLANYEELKVPEVWRYAGKAMRFLQLTPDGYAEADRSVAFPFLPPSKLDELLDARGEKTELQMVKEFVAWVRENAGNEPGGR